MELSKFVFHSVNDLNDGCCVLVGNYIITAGHVVSNQDLTIIIDGITYNFSKENALLHKFDEGHMDGKACDLAIFHIPSVYSPLEFDTSFPAKGELLKSISYEHRVEPTDEPDCLFGGTLNKEYYLLQECDATVSEVDGNFFQCDTSIVLKPGSSGSPVFKDGRVFGILHGGQPGEKKCVFQSAASIIDFLNKNSKLK